VKASPRIWRSASHSFLRIARSDQKANIVLGKPLGVLPEAELLKPRSNLLHRGSGQVCAPSSFPDRHNIQIQPMNVATKKG
jgi:hypothetical protein